MPEIFTVPSRGVGLPDYSQPKPVGQVPVGQVYTSTDVAELAVRLGSPITHDRRGNVIWYDSFERNLSNWEVTPYGINSAIAISEDYARSGKASAKLTTGNVHWDYARLRHFHAYPVLSKLGGEISFNWHVNIEHLVIALRLWDGTLYHTASVHIDQANKRVDYLDENGVYQKLFDPLHLNATLNLFHTCKLVADFVNKKYERLILDSDEYSMKSIPIQTTGDTTHKLMQIYIRLITGVDANVSAHFDDCILTQNE